MVFGIMAFPSFPFFHFLSCYKKWSKKGTRFDVGGFEHLGSCPYESAGTGYKYGYFICKLCAVLFAITGGDDFSLTVFLCSLREK